MKALRALLLILSIVLGHAHACHAVWRLPDGQECQACSETKVEVSRKAEKETVSTSGGDCRVCCKLTHCDDEKPDPSALANIVPPLVMARIEAEIVLPPVPVVVHNPISAVVALHLPNAPPALQSARAPPFLLG